MSGITLSNIHWRSYLPDYLLRRLATTPRLDAPDSHPIEAVLLLSDIQGFSVLVQRAVESGRGGLESLSSQLNAYFAMLAEVVLGEGGDVLSVAGDAFLCLFEPAADEDTLAGAAQRAARAGARIQQRLRDGGMPTRIGVAAGTVAVGQVGGHDQRWDLVLGGPALEQVVAAERACPPGEVLLCGRCRELIGALAVLVPAGPDARQARLVSPPPDAAPRRRPPAPDVDADLLRPYVPAIVLQRELLTDKAWMAEFRYVSVLLAELPPLLPSDELSLTQLHAGVSAFQRVISRYQGTMKVDADDKGLLLLGVFGLPMRSHEDNAGRAVRCALDLVAALHEAGLPSAVGVTTGRAFCGVFGSHLRREYMLRGDVINLASRLCTAREGEVLCDRATVTGARAAAVFEPIGDLRLRGVPQPVPVWRAVAATPAAASAADAPLAGAPLVGREAERRVLDSALGDLVAGRGGLALVSAEAGLGKSRLTAELVRQARHRSIEVLQGQAASIERSTPYFAWRPVVLRLLGLGEDTPRARWPARLHERLGDNAPLLGDLLDVSIEDNAHTAQLRGDVRAGNTRVAAMQLLRAAARERPTLVVLEDLHWFDSSSLALALALAQAVAREGLPLLLVATSRRSPDLMSDAAWTELRDTCASLDPARVLELPVLGQADIRALMAQRLGVDELPEALEEFVLARVGGHPYFCEEFLLALLESGAVRVEDGRCTIGQLETMDLPTTVEGTLVSRIDGLSEPEQLCLKIGAVVGRQFAERTVAEAHPLESERSQVGARLQALCRSELTQPEGPGDGHGADPRFRFKHQITRDVAYDMMSSAQRRSLHAGVAQALETVHVLDASPPHAVLAYHWERAGDAVRALHHLERAGEQALRGGAFVEAQAFFRRAVETGRGGGVDADPARVAQWLKGQGTAQYFLGDMAGAQESLERAVGTIDRPVPASAAAGGASLRELLMQGLHALAPSRFHGREAARKVALDTAVDIYRTLGQIYYLDGDDMNRVTYVTLRGVNVGQRAGPSPALARVLANAGSMMGWLGLVRWSDAYLDAAVRMAGDGGQSGAEAYVWNITALTRAQRGAWVPALQANQRALDLVQKIGDHNLEAEVWIVRATVHDCAGDVRALAGDWPRARELALQRRNPQILCWSYLDECDALLGGDDTDGAARALELALATPTAPNDGSSVADKAQARAVVRLRQGRVDEAIEAAGEVLALVTRQPPSGYHWVHFLAVATEVLIDAAATRPAVAADAQRGVRALLKLSGRFRNVLPRSRWLQARLLQGAAARQRYAEALRLAEQNDMPFERARALVALASLPDATADERARARDDAGPTFARLGAVHEARRWAAVLGG